MRFPPVPLASRWTVEHNISNLHSHHHVAPLQVRSSHTVKLHRAYRSSAAEADGRHFESTSGTIGISE